MMCCRLLDLRHYIGLVADDSEISWNKNLTDRQYDTLKKKVLMIVQNGKEVPVMMLRVVEKKVAAYPTVLKIVLQVLCIPATLAVV